jgi:MFS transporter, DHA1 family, arabinose polymer utilization protein
MQLKKSLIPLALGGLGIGTTEFVMMGVLPDVAKTYGISIPEAGHFISAYALGVVIGAPVLVAASSRVKPKRILLGLMVMFTVFNTLSAFAPNPTLMFLARLFAGLPHGAFFGVGSVVASRLADEGKQAQAISTMFSGLAIANLATVPLETWIGHHYSWRYTFGSIGLIGTITLASLYFFLPSLPVARTGNIKSELKVFTRMEPWLVFLVTAIGTGGLFCWISYIAPLLTEVTHLAADKVPYVLVVAGFGMVVGNIIGGKLADKLNPVKACIVLLFAMAATLVSIYFLSGGFMLSMLLTFLMGCCSLALGAPIQILMIQTCKGAEMLGASVTQAAFNLGNALGAFLGGLPIAAGYGFTSPSLVGLLMALGGICFAWVLMMRHRLQPVTEEVALEMAE